MNRKNILLQCILTISFILLVSCGYRHAVNTAYSPVYAVSPDLQPTPTSSCQPSSIPSTMAQVSFSSKDIEPSIAPPIHQSQSTPLPSPLPTIDSSIVPLPVVSIPIHSPKRPVIFAPGFMEAIPAVFFFGIKDYLKQQGWEDLIYLNNGLVMAKAEKYAERLKQKVETLKQETGAQKVDIIGHSYGGVYTRYYLKYLEGTHSVEHFISIASPQKGTQLAQIGSFLKSAKQMTPGNDWLEQLNQGDPTPGDVCYTTIRSNLDGIVYPYDSAYLEGANNYFIRSKNHFTILFSKETYQIIEKTLSKPCDCCRVYG